MQEERTDFEKLVICRKYVDFLNKAITSLHQEIGMLESEKQELEDANHELNQQLDSLIRSYKEEIKSKNRKILYLEQFNPNSKIITELIEENISLRAKMKEFEALKKENKILKGNNFVKKELLKESYMKSLLENTRGLQKRVDKQEIQITHLKKEIVYWKLQQKRS